MSLLSSLFIVIRCLLEYLFFSVEGWFRVFAFSFCFLLGRIAIFLFCSSVSVSFIEEAVAFVSLPFRAATAWRGGSPCLFQCPCVNTFFFDIFLIFFSFFLHFVWVGRPTAPLLGIVWGRKICLGRWWRSECWASQRPRCTRSWRRRNNALTPLKKEKKNRKRKEKEKHARRKKKIDGKGAVKHTLHLAYV